MIGKTNSYQKIDTLCGMDTGQQMVSTGMYMYVYFETDDTVNMDGFKISYRADMNAPPSGNLRPPNPGKPKNPKTTTPEPGIHAVLILTQHSKITYGYFYVTTSLTSHMGITYG